MKVSVKCYFFIDNNRNLFKQNNSVLLICQFAYSWHHLITSAFVVLKGCLSGSVPFVWVDDKILFSRARSTFSYRVCRAMCAISSVHEHGEWTWNRIKTKLNDFTNDEISTSACVYNRNRRWQSIIECSDPSRAIQDHISSLRDDNNTIVTKLLILKFIIYAICRRQNEFELINYCFMQQLMTHSFFIYS